jgi:hypothetical protein
VVGLHDGGDDSEAEPAAAGSPRARRVAAGEALEGLRQQLGGDPRAVVGDREARDGLRSLFGRREVDRHDRSRRCVDPCVGEQVVHDLREGRGVTMDREWVFGDVQLPDVLAPRRLCVRDAVDQQQRQVDGSELDGATGVEAGQLKEVAHEPAHPHGLRLDAGQGVPDVIRKPVPARAGQLGVAADRGQGCAQLMTGVSDELPDPRLTGLAGGQGRGHVGEHLVQRRPHLSDLRAGVGVLVRDPLTESDLTAVQGQLGDPPGGPGDPTQRLQCQPDDRRSRQTGDQQAKERDDPGHGGQPEDGGVHGPHGESGHQDVAVLLAGRDEAVVPEVIPEIAGVRTPVDREGKEGRRLIGGQGVGLPAAVKHPGLLHRAADDART